MDEYLILEFAEVQKAQEALTAINAVVFGWCSSRGYTVEDGALISKNASTGLDAPDKTRTTTWAVVRESPDGTFWFPSLSNDPRFADWRDYMPQDVDAGMEKAFPAAWVLPFQEEH